ncbi:SusC/RagA family TonB-linked outer membrane protein [Pedobacter petrophilus]|uniref:SusC/RagA family TonB-linked outer membrane protein n=1 Tax=Pedobacter petrophilus TaxID=1908241 RepID=A0A7K0G3L5_9SPHI|nr:TonB-dependent receptor [Pedobacter petrophilus]MRX78020.1 SusC/RagA family TonB-linked outer membrane protein [Pedobacter petrophilus]
MRFKQKLFAFAKAKMKMMALQVFFLLFLYNFAIAGNTLSNEGNFKSSFNSINKKLFTPKSLYFLEKAEDILITGTVVDETGKTIPGVSIAEKGTKNGTTTSVDGTFSIKVKDQNSIIIFSSTGYTSKQITVGTQKAFKIILNSSDNKLDDVVVVGYGTQKKITTTGAISSITTKELTQSPVANISNSLVGRLPGLFATQTSGEPGNDASTLRIRGVGTFNGSADPLVLVDGIQVENFNNIDPNEVESLSILKDASATAVYGIRGANGVIIITTKRGQIGKPQINYTFNIASNSFTDIRKSMNSYEYASSWNRGIELDRYVVQGNTPLKYTPEEIEKYRTGSDPIFYPNTDWYNLLLKKSSGQSQHNLNIRGGQNKVKYFISIGLFDQAGLFNDFTYITKTFDANTTFKRYNFRSNFNFDVTKSFKIALDISAQTENRKLNNSASGTSRIIGDIARAAPLGGPGVVNDQLVDIDINSNNPLKALLTNSGSGGIRREYRNNLNGTVKIDYLLNKITEGLAVHGNVSLQTFNNQAITNQITVPTYKAQRTADGYVLQPLAEATAFQFSTSGGNRRRTFAQMSIDYTRSFGNHNVTGLIVYDQQKNFDPGLAFLVPQGYQSLVARTTYNYKGKYLADFNAAYNGTENFAPGKRFGFFPAGSIGWIPSEESFFPKSKLISFLKIRASYGIVGNDRVGGNRFLYRPTSYTEDANAYRFGSGAAVGTYVGYTGVIEGLTGNPDITWEKAKKANLALETYLINDKIKIVAELFSETRDNILAQPQTILNTSGLRQPAINLGRMSNKGFELDASYNDKIGDKFNYRISGNFSFARNKVLFRDEINNPLTPYRLTTGQRLGQFYGLIAEGLYNTWDEVNDANRPVYESRPRVQPGDIKFKDVNGDGVINADDNVPIGYSRTPEKTYGISLYAKFKSFDISALFQGVGNVSIGYTGFQRTYGWLNSVPAGTPDYLLESWTPERYAQGLPINFPRLSAGNSNSPNTTSFGNSSYFIADASYLRLKNVELGYTFNPKLVKRIGISNMRLFLTANNLVTWSKVFKGIDPENNIPRDDTNNEEPYPLVRTINAGINVNF